jgi:K+-transporting ATPase c subunit
MYMGKQAAKIAEQAMRAALRSKGGIDPYNSHAAAAKQYPRLAALRSAADANRYLAGAR